MNSLMPGKMSKGKVNEWHSAPPISSYWLIALEHAIFPLTAVVMADCVECVNVSCYWNTLTFFG